MDLYKVRDPAVRRNLMKLAEESRQTAWWTEFNLPPAHERFIGLEGSAATILDYQIGALPGLLQTPEYAAAVIRAWSDDPDVIQNIVNVRITRQRFLGKETALKFVVDESALRRPIGSPEVMRDQIRKLIAVGPQTDLQVLPFAVGAHQGLITGFNILQFAKSMPASSAVDMSDVVYLEGLLDSALFLEDPDDVKSYIQTFTGLQEKALSKVETINFLEGILRDL
ncbi:transcriptional regulator [Paractinoplanes durhamensis]|uniref:Transcriptional regulator n=2 Tax=Paractinoplanes durhamensis TaxID=113563 RepID=A0ABQ3Z8P3_9ACTN|nr:transcriptional regulator [Actinoplanes durhamensis]